MGGTDDPSNLVELTIYDHAIAHRHLWKMYGDDGDRKACCFLLAVASKGDELYENMSSVNKKIWSDPALRKKHSDRVKTCCSTPEARNNFSLGQKKRFSDPQHRKRVGESSKARYKDPEARIRQSEATKRGIAAAKARRAAATTQES